MNIPLTAELHPIFPRPVLVASLGESFSDEELSVLLNLRRKKGFSNHVSEDFDVFKMEELSRIKSLVQTFIDAYVENVMSPKEPLDVYITQSWVNYTRPGQSHHLHSHPNSFISGVLYIQTNPGTDSISFIKTAHEPWLIERTTSNTYNSRTHNFNVNTGMLILFPSDLQHKVEPVQGDKVRISLSFNTFLRGSIGSLEGRTRLELL